MERKMRGLFLLLTLVSSPVAAGVYGAESWGEMYWGANAATAPTSAPTIASAVASDDQITITLESFPVGTGADGWSAVTSFIVSCGETTIETSESAVTISGLEGDTEYSCSVIASNAQGDGPATLRLIVTEPALKGLNILLICSVVECGVKT
jgi:hydroxymethylglutaryl-CoA reductase